jgi:hypothetical protein
MANRGLAQLQPHLFKLHFCESLDVCNVIKDQNVALTVIENEILVGDLNNLVWWLDLSLACIFVYNKLQS